MIIMKQTRKPPLDQSKGLTRSKTYDCLEKRAWQQLGAAIVVNGSDFIVIWGFVLAAFSMVEKFCESLHEVATVQGSGAAGCGVLLSALSVGKIPVKVGVRRQQCRATIRLIEELCLLLSAEKFCWNLECDGNNWCRPEWEGGYGLGGLEGTWCTGEEKWVLFNCYFYKGQHF